jgi:hypothetical protein
MQIVRILWGTSLNVTKEIPLKPVFENEIVFVWGTFNNEYLIKLGYKTILISKDVGHFKYSTFNTHFGHKIYALKLAEEIFDEYLFLDWDITFAKPIDSDFYKKIRQGNDIQCPLYSYNLDYKEENELYVSTLPPGKDSSEYISFIYIQFEHLLKYHWKYEDSLVIPCTCFYYSNNNKIMSKLLEIIDEFKLESVSDEFSLYLYLSNYTLDEYISKYEPLVLNGKISSNLILRDTSINNLNKYISEKIEKDIYLLHDIK